MVANPDGLIFLVTRYYGKLDNDYHLAVDREGVVHTSCGSVMMPSLCKDAGVRMTIEPKGKTCCFGCGKAPAVKNFTARFFKGEKLSFTRQKTKRVKKTKETEEYRYEDEYNLEGLFEGREI